VTHREYRNQNGIYRTKQAVGKLVKDELKVKISPDDIARILEGKLYDVKCRTLI